MDREYAILIVTRNDRAMVARLLRADVADIEIGNALCRDHQRLADEECDSVTLDLRETGRIGPGYISHVFRLYRSLNASNRHLTVLTVDNLANLFHIWKFDQIMNVIPQHSERLDSETAG